MLFSSIVIAATVIASGVKAQTYTLNFTYDYTNWYDAWTFEDLPDPTHGTVEYQNLANAQALGLTKIIGNQVYMGVDNQTVITDTSEGRKSIWLESKAKYDQYLLIADFEHMPGSDCGTWPGFWSINEAEALGEIDIIEGANTQLHNDMTLHTKDECTFAPRNETGATNGAQCSLSSGNGGCDTQGGLYGTAFNNVSGGVYATLWNNNAIQIFFWERKNIPDDISSGNPTPQTWGVPLAQFAATAGNCDIDANFQTQTLYFDTTFCGANAGGEAWTQWSTCSQTTGYSTCEAYVRAVPGAFDDAYWLVNYVKVYMETGSTSPTGPASVFPTTLSTVASSPASSASPTTSVSVSSVQPPASHTTSSVSVSSAKPSASSIKSSASASAPSAKPSGSMEVSIDGTCGSKVTCLGSIFGGCCSSHGYCGSSSYYCGTGCQTASGNCSGSSSSSVSTRNMSSTASATSPTPSSMRVSDYGNCGGSINTTCLSSVFGNCCSQWGFCGSSDAYCGDGCQSKFGSCA